MSNELLFEIGHEEIPASYMEPALRQIKELTERYLSTAGFRFVKISSYGTPRRMVLVVDNLTPSTKSQELKKILPKIISGISFPKTMRWHTFDVRFARPIRWVVAIYNGKIIDFPFEILKPDKYSYGHRFMAPEKFEVKSFDQYKNELQKRYVIVDPKERKRLIKEGIEAAAKKVNGRVLSDDKLLETVTWLVEYPVVLLGTFKKEFLMLPKEVLITAMRSHQKYFSVVDEKNNLLPYFITVSNIEVEEPGIVIQGNERVLTARLNDAQFLYNADKKIPLDKRVKKLKNVVFQEKLGSMFDKTQRIVKLTEFIATSIDKKIKENAKEAAYLSKADLVTEMVGEFPDLQGVMGKYYAQLAGVKEVIAKAIEDHYLPRYIDDSLPTTKEGAFVGLADKLDTLVGYFALGLKPTATEDPYALRRQAIGILQIIWNGEFGISLEKLIDRALNLHKKVVKDREKIKREVKDFIASRLENILEAKKLSKPVVEAVLALGFDNLALTKARTEAINSFKSTKEFERFKSALKRVRNILGDRVVRKSVKKSLLKEDAEKRLYKEYTAITKDFMRHIKKGEYKIALEMLLPLASHINNFFDNVLVMTKDRRVKENRLALLAGIYLLTKEIADFSKII